MNTLHIHSQHQWHDEAYIVGNKESLQLLVNVINKAISDGIGEGQFCVNDGEGFDTHIHCVDDQQTLDKLAVPYTSDVAEEKDKAAIWPWTHIRTVDISDPNKCKKGGTMESTKDEPLARKWTFLAEAPDKEFCLDENGDEIDHGDAVCKCYIGTMAEASREAVRRGILHEDQHPSFLSCTITYESQGIVEQE